ncbi:HAMP domain-containing sensor histidine kinase [Corticicoccus populi]|uniref:histidine kinase n=1 Tax=Corticicoccus populi TaxID=1812821 RepID=A0ABW5WTM3_9STAP
MKFFNSVVTKLWFTIILMVTAVLIILTIILSFYFRNYVLNSTESILEEDLHRVEELILREHDVDGLDSVQLLHEDNLILYTDNRTITPTNQIEQEIQNYVRQLDTRETTVIIDDIFDHSYMVKISYLDTFLDDSPVIIKYRDLEVINESIIGITLITIISGGIIFILTTFFAFFLISRITRPLINLKRSSFKTAQGTYNKLEVLSRDEIGELTLAFNKMNDDIEKNIAMVVHERNLREQIFNSMDEGVLYFNDSFELLYSNQKGAEMYENLKSYPEEAPLVQDNVREVMTEKSGHIERIELDSDHYQLSYTPVEITDSSYGVIILIRNITQEVNTEKMRSEFIANVSHELKTPMVMLSGYSEALLDDVVSDPEEVKEMVGIIKDESDRMNKMVNELIGLARMEAESGMIHKSSNDFMALLSKLAFKFKHDIKENDISLNINTPHDSVIFNFDYDKMENVVNNLLDNAIRYTSPGDSITIDVSIEDDITILISDTGTGIKKEHQNRIFERFYKVDESRTRGKHGTGLGLYIVKSIIESHGGSIKLESEFGVGSTFIIKFPKQ